MRLFVARVSHVSVTLIGLLLVFAPESCVLAERDLGDGGKAMAQAAPDDAAEADVLGGCICCGKTILPLSPTCSGDVAFVVAAGDCPKGCKEKFAYILCEGVCYSECACSLPAGFSLVDGGS